MENNTLTDLLDLLSLEKIEEGIYRGNSQNLGLPQVFGGQVIGQALSATKDTLNDHRPVHSLHSYFLRPGDASRPIIYDVENLRDGRSISTRRVKAIQHGKPIFFMTASFHVQADGLEHQAVMPEVEGPENLTTTRERIRKLALEENMPLPERFEQQSPIIIKPVESFNPLKPEATSPVRHVWMKTNGGLPDDPRVHKYMLAYASDMAFLPVAGQPHGISFFTKNFQMATIDHSMWFHRDFRFDDWLLYQIDSPSATNQRGFVLGKFFDRKGRLVASTAQEGVMRESKKKSS
ncbi:MAG: acyl-CoA thioesterase II [Kangiellaceae bacterium]|jgi:acyl-CoA thioesterase II